MMKRLFILPAALALANCSVALPTAISTITEAVAVNQDKVAVPATQALIVAHNAYQGAAAAATLAVESGMFPKDKLDQLSAWNNWGKAALDRADQGIDVATNAAMAMNAVAAINKLIGK